MPVIVPVIGTWGSDVTDNGAYTNAGSFGAGWAAEDAYYCCEDTLGHEWAAWVYISGVTNPPHADVVQIDARIQAYKASAEARYVYATQFNGVATFVYETSQALTTSPAYYYFYALGRPGGGAWTIADVASFSFGGGCDENLSASDVSVILCIVITVWCKLRTGRRTWILRSLLPLIGSQITLVEVFKMLTRAGARPEHLTRQDLEEVRRELLAWRRPTFCFLKGGKSNGDHHRVSGQPLREGAGSRTSHQDGCCIVGGGSEGMAA